MQCLFMFYEFIGMTSKLDHPFCPLFLNFICLENDTKVDAFELIKNMYKVIVGNLVELIICRYDDLHFNN
jgi:hypothetical protein